MNKEIKNMLSKLQQSYDEVMKNKHLLTPEQFEEFEKQKKISDKRISDLQKEYKQTIENLKL